MIADISITEKGFGSKILLSNVHFSIGAGEKVGIVGRNGVGKSTLFNLVSGIDTEFLGEIIFRRGTVVVATQQEHHAHADQTVLQYILQGLPEYAHLSQIIETYPLTMGDDLKKITTYTEALQRFDDLGYYTVEEQIVRELENFQLPQVAHGPFMKLSGGQKRLIEVVKVMHASAQLALVDEPTNHMDYVAKSQFIEWLKAAPEAVLVITHDRDVLHEVDRIIEIKDGGSVSYPGNYDAYLKQNATKTSNQMNDFEQIERRIVNLKAKVIDYQRLKEKSRNPGTIQKFKRLEMTSREELASLQAIEKPTFWIDKGSVAALDYKSTSRYDKFKTKNIRMNVDAAPTRSKHVLVSAKDVSLGYGKPLFQPLHIDLREGEIVELRGRNGAGKTTLIKALLQASQQPHESSPQLFSGELFLDAQARIGVYDQEIKATYFNLGLAEAIERMYLDRQLSIGREKIMQLMSDYLFDPIGDAQTPLSRLSGGQKARFQLITMLANEPQLLILDEPTNHLDLPSIEELEEALKKYSGAIMYVSHDGYFRRALGGEVVELRAVSA